MKNFILILFFILYWTPAVNASLTSQDYDNEIQRLAHNYEKTKSALLKDEEKQREVLASLYHVNTKMKKISKERGKLLSDKLALKSNIGSLAQIISQLDNDLQILKNKMRARLQIIYKIGGQGLMRLLFSSDSINELERSTRILTRIADKDLEIIKNYIESGKVLRRQKEELRLEMTRFDKIEKDILAQEEVLKKEHAHKNVLLKKLKSSKLAQLKKLDGIRKKTADYEELVQGIGNINEFLKASMFEKKGTLPHPVQAPVRFGFGLLRDSEFKIVLRHKGHFYSAPVGTPVYPIFHGTVTYIGRLAGYGNTLIIDHGDHYYSVYSHLNQIFIKNKDRVEPMTLIAHSGNTSEEFGQGIYFEIRHFSEPDDPKSWLGSEEIKITYQ